MSHSDREQRLQTTSKEGCPPRIGMEFRKQAEAHSSCPAGLGRKAGPNTNAAGLLERILSEENLNRAYKRVLRNKGSHGVDGMPVTELRAYLSEHGAQLKAQILDGTYRPQPVRRVDIPKPGGGLRSLGIPTVVDRVIQQAIAQQLGRIFEPTFSEHSFGFRPGRSTHMALLQAREIINDGYTVVVDMDLEKFFDRVNHDILMHLVAREVKDPRVLKLIRRYLNAGVMEHGIRVLTDEGVPQGGPLSPLLSNVMLTVLDRELERRGHRFCRYADDCNIYVRSRKAGYRVMESITRFLEEMLRLKVNADKSAVDSPTRRKFLGYSFYWSRNGYQFRVHPKSIERLKRNIREATNRNRSMNFEDRLALLTRKVRGWINHFRLADMKRILQDLDGWVRRRLRACIWKTWKRIRTRYMSLRKLGIPDHKAWEYANTRKGYWRISGSPFLHHAISTKRLERRGYVSMSTLYAMARG